MASRLLQSLCGMPVEVILARIFEGDPLELQAAVMRGLRCNGFLIDPDRCLQHSLEEIAFEVSGTGQEFVSEIDEVWIERCVDRACDQILAKDLEDQDLGERGAVVDAGTHRYLSEAFGITWGQGRSASVAFHALGLQARLTFFAVCVDRMPAMDWLEMTGGTHDQLRDDIWDVFCALGYVSEGEVAEFRARG
jgi:hypothetical protein